jgi:Cu(I)/Ag(I) efflux system membrane fusion protein
MKKSKILLTLLLIVLLSACESGDKGSDNSASMDGGKEIDYWVAPMDANYRRDEPGKSPMGMDLVPVYKEKKAEKKIAYWVAPMDANYRRDEPGKSPMGMDLVAVYEETGDDADAVKISPAMVQNLGVRTAVVEKGRLGRMIDTVGYVSFD